MTAVADLVDAVRRCDINSGDRLVVATKNSVYSLTANSDGTFEAGGGWFHRENMPGTRIEVRGCVAGGHAIFTDYVAVRGLFMEFGDGLRTTRITSVRLIPAETSDR
jgi:hypothetical protein